MNNTSINTGMLLSKAWQIPVYGVNTKTEVVAWTTAVDIGNQGGAWVNETSGLIFFRDPAIRVDSQNDYWLAWEKDKTVNQMQRVVAKTLEYMNEDRVLDTKQIWVDMNNDNRRWDPLRQKFVDRLTGGEL